MTHPRIPHPLFLDLDGVCCDLMGGVSARARLPHPWPPAKRVYLPSEQIASERIVEQLLPFWDTGVPEAGADLWAQLQPMPWLPRMMRMLECWYRRADMHVLSNPGRDGFAEFAASGKIRWSKQHLNLPARRVILGTPKHFLAAPSRVLIDDTDENIAAWRAHGGIGILFPQPWNSARDHLDGDSVAYVEGALRDAFPVLTLASATSAHR